jgi:predicted nucleic acid-binding protein
MPKPLFILDTGPLITFCAYPKRGKQAYIHAILEHAHILIVDAVMQETLDDPKRPDAQIALAYVEQGLIEVQPSPIEPILLNDETFSKVHLGERETIKLARSMSHAQLVIDDRIAFQVASRFDLHPIVTHDMIVVLQQSYHGLPYEIAVEMAETTAVRFPRHFLPHTLAKLEEGSNG